jgi:hypothetical protein
MVQNHRAQVKWAENSRPNPMVAKPLSIKAKPRHARRTDFIR